MSISEMALKSLERSVLFEHIVDTGLLIMDAGCIDAAKKYMKQRIEETPDLLNDEVINDFYARLFKRSRC